MWMARVCSSDYLKSGFVRGFLTVAASGNGRETGLYGFDQLKTAKGFQRFVDDAIDR